MRAVGDIVDVPKSQGAKPIQAMSLQQNDIINTGNVKHQMKAEKWLDIHLHGQHVETRLIVYNHHT